MSELPRDGGEIIFWLFGTEYAKLVFEKGDRQEAIGHTQRLEEQGVFKIS